MHLLLENMRIKYALKNFKYAYKNMHLCIIKLITDKTILSICVCIRPIT